jgi:hypothetical protein
MSESLIHVHCKSILVVDMETVAKNRQQQGAYVYSSHLTRTTYRMDSVEEHQFDLDAAAVSQEAWSRVWRGFLGFGHLVPAIAKRACVLLAIAGAVWFAAQVARRELSPILLGVGAALVLVLWIGRLVQMRYEIAWNWSEGLLVRDEIRRTRSLADDVRFEVVPINEWDDFIQRLGATN